MRHFLARLAGAAPLVLAATVGSGVVWAQSLADVARAEEARRKVVPKATKVYTNQDLQPDVRARQSVPAEPEPAEVSPSPTAEVAPAPAGREPEANLKRDEKYWRSRITEARERLERSHMFAEALQSRINALTTDFVNRDDYAQQAVIGQDRQKALTELTRVQGEIRDLTKAITDIEEEARRAGVPPGWLR